MATGQWEGPAQPSTRRLELVTIALAVVLAVTVLVTALLTGDQQLDPVPVPSVSRA